MIISLFTIKVEIFYFKKSKHSYILGQMDRWIGVLSLLYLKHVIALVTARAASRPIPTDPHICDIV
jgi:hypothetical protein